MKKKDPQALAEALRKNLLKRKQQKEKRTDQLKQETTASDKK